MPSLAKAYTELAPPWPPPPPPPPPPRGGAGAAGPAGVGAGGGAAPRAGAAPPRPRMSSNPCPGSPTIARAALTRFPPPPPPRPGAGGSTLVGRVAAAVKPPGQTREPLCRGAAEDLTSVFQ